MDFKKHIYWIVLAAVVLVAVGVYTLVISSVTTTAETAKAECLKMAESIHKGAGKGGDELKNEGHVAQAKEFRAKAQEQIDTLLASLKKQKLEQRFSNVPVGNLQFDSWLNERRTALANAASEAKLQLPPDVDRLMFAKDSTSETSSDVTRHRDYRLNQMAVLDEVITILCKTKGKQKVTELQLNSAQPENTSMVDAGAMALEKVTLLGTKETAERAKAIAEDVANRTGTTARGAVKVGGIKELPISVTSMDIQFVAPLNVVPAIVNALETSTRYSAVVTRFDFQRAAPTVPSMTDMVALSPAPADTAPATAVPATGAAPAMPKYTNTHFREGPVRVAISMDLYEYDKAKEAAFKTASK